jgi:hypothetical protein
MEEIAYTVGPIKDDLDQFFIFVSLSVQPVLHLSVFHGIFTGFVSIYMYIYVCVCIYMFVCILFFAQLSLFPLRCILGLRSG